MRTRSSSNLPVVSFNPSTSNLKRRNRRRSKHPFILEESLIDTMADQRTMAELLREPTKGYAEAIVVPSILAEQFELKHNLINMMTSDQFFKLEKDNPHGAARWWLEKEPPRSIHTWEDLVSKFINEFFPPSRTTNLRNEISNFQQRFDESFHEACDRYKDLLRVCPHHGFTKLHQLDTFYNALNPADQDSLNAAAGGNLLERPTQDVLTIIENKSKCLATGGTTFPELQDNIQGYASAAAVNYNQGNSVYRLPGSRSLPSNTVANPKGKLKAITTRSGIVLDGPTVPTSPPFINPEEDERIEETLTDPDLAEYIIKLHINITLADALILMPKYYKMLKALLSNKKKLQELANTPFNENFLVVILKKLPKKLGNPGKFIIPCLPELISTRMTLELANRAICTPAGIARDVFVPVGKFTFPADFVIVDYESDPRVPFILGRPFLRTDRALIDIHGEEMILCDGDERLILNIRHDTSSYSNQPQKESINLINVFNNSSEYFLEDLFSNQPSGNPTFFSHPELTSSKVNDVIFDSEGGKVLPEKLLDLDSTKDLYPPLHVNPLSGITTYSSSPLLKELADELALIIFPPKYDDDLYNLANLADNFVDSMPEMFIDEHALDYSSPLIFDEYDDDFLEVESDAENVYDDHVNSKGEKIKESKLLIDELDLPCDFLLSKYDSFISYDFSRVDAKPSTNNKDKVFNPCILIQEKPFEIITRIVQDKNLAISNASLVLEDFDPPFYEPLFFKEVPRFTASFRLTIDVAVFQRKPIATTKVDQQNCLSEKPSPSFDELMSTPIDFSSYVMHSLKIDNLTQEHLVRPTFNLLKGTCKSHVELKYNFEKCYKAVNDRLDWNNPEGKEYLFDLSKPLPLIMDHGRQVVPANFFFNNDLESRIIIKAIDKLILERRLMRSLEKSLVGEIMKKTLDCLNGQYDFVIFYPTPFQEILIVAAADTRQVKIHSHMLCNDMGESETQPKVSDHVNSVLNKIKDASKPSSLNSGYGDGNNTSVGSGNQLEDEDSDFYDGYEDQVVDLHGALKEYRDFMLSMSGVQSTATFLREDGGRLLPSFMRRDIDSLFGNEVKSSMEEGAAAMENLVRKLGNAKERAKCKKLKKELEEARGVMFEERPNDAIDVSVEDEENVANQMGWTKMKKLMTAEFCPVEELQRIENELWNLKVNEYNMVAYTQRFNELALICPRMVEPKSTKIDAYIRGLSDNIKGMKGFLEGNKQKWENFLSGNSSDQVPQVWKDWAQSGYCKEKNVATGANAQFGIVMIVALQVMDTGCRLFPVGAPFTQRMISSIPIGGNISLKGFLLPILLLVVIIVTVVIVAVILVVVIIAIVGVVIVVTIIGVVFVIGVFAIIKLSFVIISFEAVTFPSILLGNPSMKTSISVLEFGTIVGHKVVNSWNLLIPGDLVGLLYSNRFGIGIPPGQGILGESTSSKFYFAVLGTVATRKYRFSSFKPMNETKSSFCTIEVERLEAHKLLTSRDGHEDNEMRYPIGGLVSLEQTDGEAMINSIKNGDQPLPRVTQVSIAGTTSTEQPPLKDKSIWSDQEKRIQKIDRLVRSLLIQGLPNDIYSLIDSNKTAKDLWDALARHMLGSEYGEQDRKVAVLYEYETFKANEGEFLLDTYIRYLQVIDDLKKCGYSKYNCELNFKFLNNLQPEWKQYATMMRQNKNLMDINIDALYNILKQNQRDVNDTMGSKKKTIMVTSDPLALIAEKTNVSRSKEKVVVSSDSEGSETDDFSELKKITAFLAKAFNGRKFYSKPTNNNFRTSSSSQSINKKQEFVKTDNKRVERKDDEKKRDMSRVKCYNCKKEGHFAKDCKKAKTEKKMMFSSCCLLA
uniref:Reverse transcriptase domain-containing protein n=1 Tax=Tanacetum cinerariifolium TaxID=118510 RepID=A0A6L2L9A5_TANCI|nr:reverse transcriptase domain-containing protein [Tanacetum cinerariifolium]